MTKARDSSYKWVVVGLLWWVCFFNYADRQAIFSIFPLLKTQMHLGNLQLGIIASAFMWMYALFGPVAGWVCDRLPRRAVILGALTFWSLMTAATALCHGFASLVFCRALGGLGEAFYFPAAMSLIGDYHRSTRSRAMSLHQSSVYAGSITGGFLSGYMGDHHGWRSSFLVLGVAGLVLVVVLFGSLREPLRGQVDGATPPAGARRFSLRSGLRAALSNGYVLIMFAVFAGANFVAVVFLTWLPTFLFEKFHMSLSMAGFSATAYLQAASVLGVLAGGLLADRFARRSAGLGRGGRMLTQAIGLLAGVPFLIVTGWTTRVGVILIAMTLFGLCKGLYDANIFASLYDVTPVERRGTTAGLMNSLGWLGGGFAPLAIAAGTARFGMSSCISATAVLYFCAGLAILTAALHRIRTAPAATA